MVDDRQAGLYPAVISWGLDSGFTTEFDLPGTRDPSAHLTAPEAIALWRELGGEEARARNHELAWSAALRLAAMWGSDFSTPKSMIGPMATLAAPAGLGGDVEAAARLRDGLLDEDGIEVQVHAHQGRIYVRIAAQIYNEAGDYERLGEAVLRRA